MGTTLLIASTQTPAWWVMTPCLVVTGVTLAAAISDVRTHRISNRLTLPVFLAGLAFHTVMYGAAGLADAFGGALVAFIPFLVMYAFAGGGAGDAKLMAAVGAWVGFGSAWIVVVAVLIAGGLCAIVYAVYMGRVKDVWAHLHWMYAGRQHVSLPGKAGTHAANPAVSLIAMPYGVAIFLGSLVAWGYLQPWQSIA